MPILLCLLLLISLALLARLLLIKREITHIYKQLSELDTSSNQLIDICLIDSALNDLTAAINKNLMLQRTGQVAVLRNEQQLKESISNISHDLRTPLTAIIGYLQLLEGEESPEKQQEYLQIIMQKSLDLKALLHSFFELSYFESQQLETTLEEIDLSELLIEELLREAQAFERKAIQPRLKIQDNCRILSDKKLLRRILQNLIANVLQHGQQQAAFTLTEAQHVELVIQNTYDSSSPVEVERLFSRFYVSDESRSRSGLGLAIVALLAQTLGIRITTEVVDNSFTMRLSFQQSQKEADMPD